MRWEHIYIYIAARAERAIQLYYIYTANHIDVFQHSHVPVPAGATWPVFQSLAEHDCTTSGHHCTTTPPSAAIIAATEPSDEELR